MPSRYPILLGIRDTFETDIVPHNVCFCSTTCRGRRVGQNDMCLFRAEPTATWQQTPPHHIIARGSLAHITRPPGNKHNELTMFVPVGFLEYYGNLKYIKRKLIARLGSLNDDMYVLRICALSQGSVLPHNRAGHIEACVILFRCTHTKHACIYQ